MWFVGAVGLDGPLLCPRSRPRPLSHAGGGLSRPRSPPTPKLLPPPLPGRASFSDPGVPRLGWRLPGDIPQASNPHRCGPESTPASTTFQERSGLPTWYRSERSPSCHLRGHLLLWSGVTRALLAWERDQSSAAGTERPLLRLSGSQARCWGLPL